MHIIIGILTAVAGLFWAITALQNSGAIDSLNPFLWHRRSQWKKKYTAKPMHSLSTPLEVAGLLIVGIAKTEGQLSKDQKNAILAVFKGQLHLNTTEAQQLYKSSSFLIKDEDISENDINKIFERSKANFSNDQVDSILSIMKDISNVDNPISAKQQMIIKAIDNFFQSSDTNKKMVTSVRLRYANRTYFTKNY